MASSSPEARAHSSSAITSARVRPAGAAAGAGVCPAAGVVCATAEALRSCAVLWAARPQAKAVPSKAARSGRDGACRVLGERGCVCMVNSGESHGDVAVCLHCRGECRRRTASCDETGSAQRVPTPRRRERSAAGPRLPAYSAALLLCRLGDIRPAALRVPPAVLPPILRIITGQLAQPVWDEPPRCVPTRLLPPHQERDKPCPP